jgi:NADPH2:quinone reductase
MADLTEWLRDGTVKPAITERITLDQVPDALERMSRREVSGKVVVVP